MSQHGIDRVVRDRGEPSLSSDVRRLPATPTGQRGKMRATDHDEVDASPRDDMRVDPPAMGGKARDEEDRSPFEVDGVEGIDVKADLEDAGILGGLLSLFA